MGDRGDDLALADSTAGAAQPAAVVADPAAVKIALENATAAAATAAAAAQGDASGQQDSTVDGQAPVVTAAATEPTPVADGESSAQPPPDAAAAASVQDPTAQAASADAAAAPAPLACWDDFPPETDGWVMAHDALRLDMSDFESMVDTTLRERIANSTLERWMGRNLQVWFEHFVQNVHAHHDHEENLFFPEMNKRVTVPPKMTADHKELMAAIKRCVTTTTALTTGISEGKPAAELLSLLEAVLAEFRPMKTEMLAHLNEEETIGLPLFRSAFTKKDALAIEKKIQKDLPVIDIGWLLRPVASDEDKMRWLTVSKVPFPVRKFLLFPIARKGGKYDKKYTRLMDEVVAGVRKPPSSGCSVM